MYNTIDNAAFIQELANVVYTSENMERANQYLATRGLDGTKFRFPWVATGTDQRPFERFRKWYSPPLFVESLYIPVPSIQNPKVLEGLDIRYLGENPARTRFIKFKRDSQGSIMIYNFHSILEHPDWPVVVTEGAMDCESVNKVGLSINVVSPLTAQFGLRWCATLHAMSDKVYILYDNDEDGMKSTKKISESVMISSEVSKEFQYLSCLGGKDPNQVLCNSGKDFLKRSLMAQMGIN